MRLRVVVALGKTGGVPSAVPRPGESLADLFPDVAAEWHPTRNGELTPANVNPGTEKMIWWICNKGPDHEWSAPVNRRVRGHGCPYCAGQKVSLTNSLATKAPEVAAEWHPTKNGELTPDQVVAGTPRKVWWICDRGPDHEWPATVASRTGQGVGCPFCTHNKLSVTNSLEALFPEIAAQWHPTKNGDLTPADVVAGTAKRVWWACNKGPDHEWSTQVDTRTSQGVGCPCCSGRKASVTNSLEALFPEIAAQRRWPPMAPGPWSPTLSGWRCSAGSWTWSRSRSGGRWSGTARPARTGPAGSAP
ncbi:MAG: zinc-ribbon domain-containing protein [Gemmatimonadales bacterium]|nr:zinc-ribbon domain-containing protein [Gemmatimonadales bacterium]MBT6373707.1 zinc-ribbon domain-containing protein [Gemmatimonadales bacterium]MBT7690482.1 zinc-ribbon domain-containing protein [Gemmatimonadales bacterium]